MKLIARARALFAAASRRPVRRHGADPADMGTAFGLDAITTLEGDLDTVARDSRPAVETSRLERRSRRRSGS